MDIKLLKPGMKVFINSECELTRNEHGFSNDMEEMMGTIQTIEKVNHFFNNVIIENHNWSAGDLRIFKNLTKEKKQPTVHFEVKDLVI